MNRKTISTLILIFALTASIPILNVKSNTTLLYVDPQYTSVEIPHTFQITILISQVTDLATWDFKLYYPSALLNATEIEEGPFLKTAGSTAFLNKSFTDNYNATHGRIWAACTLIGQGSPSSPDWDPNYDINDDGVINMRDICIACNNFGKDPRVDGDLNE